MPATGARSPRRSERHLRILTLALAVGFLGSVGAATADPVEATNWSRQIAAVRAGQVAYEGMMRSADRDVHLLKRAQKQTKRKLKRAQRRLERTLERRAASKERLADTRTRVRVARAALATARMATPPPPAPIAAAAVLRTAAVVPMRDARGAAPAGTDGQVPALLGVTLETAPLAVSPATAPLAAAPVAAGPAPPPRPGAMAEVSVGDVVKLERTLKQQQRAFAKAKRKAARASRNVGATRRSLVAVKARHRAAIARREGAEAALAGRIMAMSQLAQRRAMKKTNVRPGIDSGFSWPTRGRLSQGYGCTGFRLNPPRGSCRHFHDGIDIAGYRGTPIRAAAVGVVSYIGWNPWDQEGRAFMIVVAHPGGYESLYGHVLPTRQVRIGQLVRRGEVIGYMGNTGRSTGVHLHLELRRGRTTLNPLAFL